MVQGLKKKRIQKELVGTVVSDRMDKTIVVRVGRLTVHPAFKKTIKRYSKFKAHDEKKIAKIGDAVRIVETRPISKDKRWRLVEIIRKTNDNDADNIRRSG